MKLSEKIIELRKANGMTQEELAAICNVSRQGGYGTMKLSRYEQETIVNYNIGEQNAILYTRDKAVMRKLETLVADFPDTYKLTGQDEVSKTYSFRKSYISYRKPRTVSTEQRERARKMMIANNRAKGD